MISLLIFLQFVLVTGVFLYAISKVNKSKADFIERLKVATVESDKQIYTKFIKNYKAVNKVLVCCIVLVFIISVVLFKLFVL